MAAGLPTLNIVTNYRPPNRKLALIQEAPITRGNSLGLASAPSPEVPTLPRSEVVYMRRRRLLSKVLKKMANDPSSESFEMLDDTAPKETATKRGREQT